jgi:hypothetical protein
MIPPAAGGARLDHDINLRYCICADPQNCREEIPGYVCRKGTAPAPLPAPDDLLTEDERQAVVEAQHVLSLHGTMTQQRPNPALHRLAQTLVNLAARLTARPAQEPEP